MKIESFRMIFRCMCPLSGRQNRSTPNRALFKLHYAICCFHCLQRLAAEMTQNRAVHCMLHAGQYLGRYKSDHDVFFTVMLRNSRRKSRYVPRVWVMHGTCTRSDGRQNRSASCLRKIVSQTQITDDHYLWRLRVPRATLYYEKPLLRKMFAPIKIYWKLKYESSDVPTMGRSLRTRSNLKLAKIAPLAKNILKTTGNGNPVSGLWTFSSSWSFGTISDPIGR